MELHEVREGHHKGIPNATIMRQILHLLRKYVAWIDDAGDVANGDVARGGEFTDFHLAKIDMLDSFIRH